LKKGVRKVEDKKDVQSKEKVKPVPKNIAHLNCD